MEGFTFTPALGLIVGGIIGMIIGWAVGFFDSNRNSSKKIKQAEELSQIAIQEAKDKIAQVEAQRAAAAATPVTVDDPGMLRIKNENGTLTLDLDGARVNPIALYPEQRRRLIDMLNIMRPWLENKPIPAPAPVVASPPPPPQPVAGSAPAVSTPPQPVPQSPAPQRSTPMQAPAAAPAGKKGDTPASAPTSMVGQINAILQTRIANTKLADMGVTMIESPSGGVFVYVGLNKFEGIDAVPDEDVKSAIRSAIAEWERKYTPGLQ
jgi:hypothetical protein